MHEFGGKYGLGIIVAEYQAGQSVEMRVQLTANHLGWFEFRLCPDNDSVLSADELSECFEQNVLEFCNGEEYWKK